MFLQSILCLFLSKFNLYIPLKTYTFWVNTHKEVDKERIAGLFSRVFGNPADNYRQLLSYNKNYIVLAHGVLQSQCEPILDELADIKGLFCDVNVNRITPIII